MPAPAVLATLDGPSLALVVLADVLLILVVARFAGRLARRLGQPPVIGEILAGIALGPSLLGLLGADLPGLVFPEDGREALKRIGELGLVLFLFGVGRESDPGLLRRAGGRIGAVSAGSILVPAAVGVLVALPLWADHAVVGGREVPREAFAAFVAVALSVTAFPVLARILGDAGLLRTDLGRTAMAVAAVTDLVAWSALAVVVGAYGTGGRPLPELLLLVAAYALVLRTVLRPLTGWALTATTGGGPRRGSGPDVFPTRRRASSGDADPAGDAGPTRATVPIRAAGPTRATVPTRAAPNPDASLGGSRPLVAAAVLLVGLMASAAMTDRIGLHAAIGAFAFGVLSPRGGRAGRAADTGSAGLARAGALLVPVFFLSTGLTVDLASLSLGGVGELGLLLVAATAAKFVGVAGAARLAGMDSRPAATLGVLLNARGPTELVVLEVGRSAGILDEQVFAALVAVALITTVLTGPVFRRLHRAGEERDRGRRGSAVSAVGGGPGHLGARTPRAGSGG
jgi:Kef-type K+ transport system membrane component KefB